MNSVKSNSVLELYVNYNRQSQTSRAISVNIVGFILCWTLALNFDFPHFNSSHQRCSLRKGALRNFAKFTGKHLCQSLLFNKVAIKKETLAQLFSCEFCEISKNAFFTEHLRTTASAKTHICCNVILLC